MTPAETSLLVAGIAAAPGLLGLLRASQGRKRATEVKALALDIQRQVTPSNGTPTAKMIESILEHTQKLDEFVDYQHRRNHETLNRLAEMDATLRLHRVIAHGETIE